MNTTATKPRVGRLRRSPFCKALMTVLCLFSIVSIVGGAVLSVICLEQNIYHSGKEELHRNCLESLCSTHIHEASNAYISLVESGYFDENNAESIRDSLYDQYMYMFEPSRSNFFFTVNSPGNEVLLQSYTDDYRYTHTQYFYDTRYETTTYEMTEEELNAYQFPQNAEVDIREVYNAASEILPDGSENYYEVLNHYEVTISIPEDSLAYYVTGYVRENLTAEDDYLRYTQIIDFLWELRYVPFLLIMAGIIGFLFSLWFLLSGAGYHPHQESPVLSFFDRIPLDLFTMISLGTFGCLMILLVHNLNTQGDLACFITIAVVLLITVLLILFWLVTVAVRIRTHTFWKNNCIVILTDFLARLLKQTGKTALEVPLIWQAPAAVGFYFFLQLVAIVFIAAGYFLGVALCILLWMLGIIITILVVYNMHHLDKGAARLAAGNMGHKIPEEQLFGPFRTHARHLNHIGEGMNKAVSDRMKSEMFKTELIANVSHDIRTPLTSIINYTDLLAKLELNDPQAQAYIEVLTRQSARLRKLTEDVLEASKASTGNITVERSTMDIRVLLEQIIGEYHEKMESKHLQMVCDMPETPLCISADGRLMWRVMDNLFGNICKYAMPHTRVYLDASAVNRKIRIVLRNISGTQLNVSADALMERFVRGDRSRSTEGSGLGLSIAQSLTELQGGTLKIQIDGDLFKVVLEFNEVYL